MPNDPKEFTQDISKKLYVEDIRPILQLKESQSLVHRLRTRATIRRNIKTRKSVQEGKPDLIADLLEEAAKEIQTLQVRLSTTDMWLEREKRASLLFFFWFVVVSAVYHFVRLL